MTQKIDALETMKVTGARLKDALSIWKELGYDSQQEANVGAAELFKAMHDQGFFRSKEIVEKFTRSPRVFIMTKYML